MRCKSVPGPSLPTRRCNSHVVAAGLLAVRLALNRLSHCTVSLSLQSFLRSIMQFLLETVQVLLLSIWFSLESLVFMVVPRRRKNISGQVVLITGAGSGIGRLMAQEFAALDTVVVLWDINQEGMKETARLAGQCGARRVFHYLCDCSDKTEVYKVADQVRVHRLGTDASL